MRHDRDCECGACATIRVRAQALYDLFTDPTDPFNQLKRPARRECRVCGDSYKSCVHLLADKGTCPDCTVVPADYLRQYEHKRTAERLGLTQEDMLLCAVFGMSLEDYAAGK